MTPERRAEIVQWAKQKAATLGVEPVVDELFAEIDALTLENKQSN